jgi:hypothetical protein
MSPVSSVTDLAKGHAMTHATTSRSSWTGRGLVVLLSCLGMACTASATVGTAPSPSPPSGCSPNGSVSCSKGVGWTCSAGDNPEAEVSGLSCSLPAPDGPNDDFCCFEWSAGSTCTPDDGLTSVCQPGTFGYRCQAGDNPSSIDSALNCSAPTPDGPDDDFCCR